MGEIRVAIVGVGNCAAALLQGIEYYRRNPAESIGLMHPVVGGYRPWDIRVVAAFDVDERKVGQPVERAILAPPTASGPSAPTCRRRG